MIQFTRETVVQSSLDGVTVDVYSVAKAIKGLAIYSNGKVAIVRSNGEPGIWNQAATRGKPGASLKADTFSEISEADFNAAISHAQSAGVKNIAASAMRVVFAESNDVRASLLGYNPFTLHWVKFTGVPVSVKELKAFGATPKFLMELLARGIISDYTVDYDLI